MSCVICHKKWGNPQGLPAPAALDAVLFQKIVASAALDAGMDATTIEHLSLGRD